MQKLYIILFLIILTAVSCDRHEIIPKKDLAEIYYEMYMTDEAIAKDRNLRRMTDSLHLYEPIFNKFGYTTEDYLHSVEHYLEDPEKYGKIFELTKKLLIKKRTELGKIYTYETRFDRMKRWLALDSLEYFISTEGPGKSYFKAAKFLFDNIEPEPGLPKYSLTVDRPDLDPENIRKAFIRDSIGRALTDSISKALSDSLFREMYYIDTLVTDTLTIDTLAADSLLVTDSLAVQTDSTILIRFSTPYIFMTTDTTDIVAADSTRIETDTLDITPVRQAKVYYSPIATFILRDSAMMENLPYNYDFNSGSGPAMTSAEDKNKNVHTESLKKGSSGKKVTSRSDRETPNTRFQNRPSSSKKADQTDKSSKSNIFENPISDRPLTARDSARILNEQRKRETMEIRKKEEIIRDSIRKANARNRNLRPAGKDTTARKPVRKPINIKNKEKK